MRCGDRKLGTGLVLLVALGAGAAHLRAQKQVFVPASFAAREAPGLEFWALSPFAARRQLVLDPRHVGGLANRVLCGLTVRRNGGDPSALQGGQVHVELWLSHCPRTAATAAGTFAANRGQDALRVFCGTVDVPDAPPLLGGAPAPWSAPHAVTLPFATPFGFAGGTLCLESVTRTAPPNLPPYPRAPWWPLDAFVERHQGGLQSVGASCIPGLAGQPAAADAASLHVGATAVLWLRGGRSQGGGVVAIGANARNLGALALPLDLTPFGAPGCVIHNDLVAALPFGLAPLPGGGGAGLATVEFETPLLPALAGARVLAQWWLVDPALNPLGLAGSNGLRMDLMLPPNASGNAYVESTDLAAGAGRIRRHCLPVLLFQTL